jgi:non-canonical (house-cleaning) NTP pyrophosphatase
MNRAKAAYEAACSEIEDKHEHPDFSVGLEGGLEKQSHPQTEPGCKNNHNKADELWCMAWMAIFGSQSATCIAAKAADDNFSSEDYERKTSVLWGFAKTGSFLLPPALCDLVINERMELGDADNIVFKRVNSKHGQGTVGKLTDGQIIRTEYYVHALKLALIPWVRPELYSR